MVFICVDQFRRERSHALGVGADVGDVGHLADARLADVVTARAVLLVDRLAGVRPRRVDALRRKRRRLEIENPLSDPIERGEIEGVGGRAGADRRALVALVHRVVVAVPMQPESLPHPLIPERRQVGGAHRVVGVEVGFLREHRLVRD